VSGAFDSEASILAVNFTDFDALKKAHFTAALAQWLLYTTSNLLTYSLILNKLPRVDSNHDKVIQRLFRLQKTVPLPPWKHAESNGRVIGFVISFQVLIP
jgi:hypothetical protein